VGLPFSFGLLVAAWAHAYAAVFIILWIKANGS
jgi:hypothetical protein